MSVLVMFSMF